MTEEIKEILKKTDIDAVSYGVIINYITNLQKENEKYKKIFEAKERFSKIMPDDIDFIILSKADYDRQQEDIELTAIKLKSRNEKAIEYIKTQEVNFVDVHYQQQDDYFEKLLNILEGGDE